MKVRRIIFVLLIASLLAGCALPVQMPVTPPTTEEQTAPQTVDTSRTELPGSWQGSISVMNMELEIIIDFTGEGDTLTGTIDIPQQGAADLPLHDIRFDDPAVSFAMLEGPQEAVFDGILEDGVISGTFLQSGVEGTFTLAAVDAAQETAAAPAVEETYTDPAGLFSVPVLTNWTLETFDGYATLTAPDGDLKVYVLAVPAESAEAGIEAAWQIVEPSFALEREETTSTPPMRGIEETVSIIYDTEDDNRLVTAGADLYEGIAYVLLLDGDLATIQRRVSQIQIIGTGYDIAALEDEDLTGIEPIAFDDALLAEFEAYVIEKMEQLDVPAAAISIVRDGEVVYSEGFGVRGPDSDEPVTPQTHFMIGSTGKTMTTMLMAALVDAGLMDWDTPVVEILPEFAVADPELTQQLTVRNLVCACTGVPRRDFELIFNANSQTAEDVVEELETYEFFTDFGEAFQYSNQMVGTGGYVAGAADGGEWGNLFDAYTQSLEDRILAPMGMDNTTLSFAEVMDRDNYAQPFGMNLAGEFYPIPLEMEMLLLPVAPAGAHWSTSEDMAQYLITELNRGVAPNGERIVSEENLMETWQPQVDISADTSYGLGWMIGEYKGLQTISHGGNTFGFTSELLFVPAANFGITVLTNGRGTNLFNGAVATRLLELAYAQESEIDEQVNFANEYQRNTIEGMLEDLGDVDPSAVEPFLGRYTNAALNEIELRLEDGVLRLDAGDFVSELRANLSEDAEENEYLAYDMPLAGLNIDLQMNEEGAPIVVIGAGALEYQFSRVE